MNGKYILTFPRFSIHQLLLFEDTAYICLKKMSTDSLLHILTAVNLVYLDVHKGPTDSNLYSRIAVNLVETWLSRFGIEPSSIGRSAAGDWLTLYIPVSLAETLFDAKYSVYYNPSTDSYLVRTTSYSLPVDLHGHIQVVTPTTHFGQMRPMRATSRVMPGIHVSSLSNQKSTAASSSCNTTITPSCLEELYSMAGYSPQATDVNKFGITGYLDEFPNFADLQTFLSEFAPGAVGSNFTLVEVNGGGNNQSDPGLEANLDIQYTEALTHPTPNIFYSTGGEPPFTPDVGTPNNTNEPYLVSFFPCVKRG